MTNESYETQYMKALISIYNNGYSDGVNERTKIATKRLPGVIIQVDVEKEFPILKSKFVAAKTAQREIEWIWKLQSNDISELKAHIWDEWADEKGTIGKAYGYQMAKPVDIYLDPIHKDPSTFRHYDNQSKFVIEYLRETPNGRWANVTLWNVDDLKDMQLVPCCHTSTWNLDGGRLNCCLSQRSGDMPYGVPFNTTQYAELMIMIARDLGVKPGILTHTIADAHIYANQMDGVAIQITNWMIMEHCRTNVIQATAYAKTLLHEHPQIPGTAKDLVNKAMEVVDSKPHFEIYTDDTDFFKYNADVCKVEDYINMGKIDFGDVAV